MKPLTDRFYIFFNFLKNKNLYNFKFSIPPKMIDRKKVVLVQDNKEILEIMEEALEDEGFEVIGSLTTEPIQEINKTKPDAVVVDDHIAGSKRGSQVVKELKDDVKNASVSAILTSTSEKLPKQAEECNADAYIQKPFELDEMVDVVKKNT